MARFRIGAGGLWSDTAHWSTTSGGSGGASVPTSSDAVTFDSGCSGTITIDSTGATCASLSFSNGVTLLDTVGLTVVGTVSSAGGGGQTIDINGQAQTWGGFSHTGNTLNVYFHGGSLAITGNTFTENVTNSFAKWNDAGTITFTGSAVAMTTSGTDNRYANVSINYTGSGTMSITGTSQLFANFSFAPATGASNNGLTTAVNLTCSGTFTVTGSTQYYVNVFSNSYNTPRTITAATVSISYCQFRDIVGAGAGTWSGTLIGDAGGNSGIAFTTPVSQTYSSSGSHTWSDPTVWTSRRPLPQDDVFLTHTSGTLTTDVGFLGHTIDCTGCTGGLTLGASTTFHGGLKLVSGMTFTQATFSLSFNGRDGGSYTIDTGGKQLNAGITINGISSSFALASSVSVVGGQNLPFIVNFGTFDTAGFNMTITSWQSSNSNVRSIFLRNSTIIVDGGGSGTFWDMSTKNNLTWDAGTSTINFRGHDSTSTKTFAGGSLNYYNLLVPVNNAFTCAITGSNMFASLDLECNTARTITFSANTRQTIGNLIIKSNLGNTLTVNSSSSGTKTILYAKNKTAGISSNVSLSADVLVLGSSLASMGVG